MKNKNKTKYNNLRECIVFPILVIIFEQRGVKTRKIMQLYSKKLQNIHRRFLRIKFS